VIVKNVNKHQTTHQLLLIPATYRNGFFVLESSTSVMQIDHQILLSGDEVKRMNTEQHLHSEHNKQYQRCHIIYKSTVHHQYTVEKKVACKVEQLVLMQYASYQTISGLYHNIHL